jgi:hypothetical protein
MPKLAHIENASFGSLRRIALSGSFFLFSCVAALSQVLSIATQPVSRTVALGAKTTFHVVAAGGTTGITFSWEKDGVPISGATTPVLSLVAVAGSDAGAYRCRISDSGGNSAISSSAVLTLGASAPNNYAQFANAAGWSRLRQRIYLLAGHDYTFRSRILSPANLNVASGSGSIPEFSMPDGSYSDFGGAISTITSQRLITINGLPYAEAVFRLSASVEAAVQFALLTQADCKMTDVQLIDSVSGKDIINNGSFARGQDFWSFGTDDPTVSLGTLYIASALAGGAATLGSTFTFNAPPVFGQGPLTYQWRKQGTNISGATSTSLAISSAQLTDAGSYSVVVTNSTGSRTSTAATLVVNVPPIFTSPNTAKFIVDRAGSYTLTASGSPSPTFSVTGGVLPSWATLNVNTGVLAGTPPNATGAPFAFTITASNGALPSASQIFTISVVLLHSADTSGDSFINLSELTRVIQLYNARNGTLRTGRYLVQATGTEDGFNPDLTTANGATVTLTRYHSADSDRDGKIKLTELTRVIELFNFRNGSTRTGRYHSQTGTEDGFASGP